MNTGEPFPDLYEAEYRVLVMQQKLHQWAMADRGRRFDDVFNLVYDPAFLVVAWRRVRGNKGGRTAGVDGVKPASIVFGVEKLLTGLREDLKARRFVPQRVREKTIPKASGKVRRLGIPTVADRVVQASLKLVLEPIFEADFKPCSYGFRPKRRAQDAIAEIHHLGSPNRNYHWVFEADIKACFDEIDHTALMGRLRDRIGDKRVLGLVKAFLKAGVLTEDGSAKATITGTPQGGILSPLLANIALSVLDEHFTQKWEALGSAGARQRHRRAGVRGPYMPDGLHSAAVGNEPGEALAWTALKWRPDEPVRVAHYWKDPPATLDRLDAVAGTFEGTAHPWLAVIAGMADLWPLGGQEESDVSPLHLFWVRDDQGRRSVDLSVRSVLNAQTWLPYLVALGSLAALDEAEVRQLCNSVMSGGINRVIGGLSAGAQPFLTLYLSAEL